MNRETVINILQDIITDLSSDGCLGCAYEDFEEWKEPCKMCRRASKDYYRREQHDR